MFEGVEPMGRGRAKAKQVKVARQLKYNSGGTDPDPLRAELGVGRADHPDGEPADADLVDRHRDYAGGDGEERGEDDPERPLLTASAPRGPVLPPRLSARGGPR